MESVNVGFEEQCAIVAGLSNLCPKIELFQDGTLKMIVKDTRIPAGGYTFGGAGNPSAYSNFQILDRIGLAVVEAAQREINKIREEMKNDK